MELLPKLNEVKELYEKSTKELHISTVLCLIVGIGVQFTAWAVLAVFPATFFLTRGVLRMRAASKLHEEAVKCPNDS